MARMPPFAQPGSFVRFFAGVETFPTFARDQEETRFLRLEEGIGPLKYPHTFENLAQDERSSLKVFDDLEMDPNHIAHVFLGVGHKAKVRFFHPFDTRLLRWDDQDLDIADKDAANLTHDDSPIEDPRFDFWVAPTENFVPGLDARNIESLQRPARNLDLKVLFLAQKYRFTILDEDDDEDAETIRKLEQGEIPFTVAHFGGKV